MNKLEFKALYSKYRRANREFWEHLQASNVPCGTDDAMCENHEYYMSKWLDENPIIKAVVEAESNGDELEDRANNMYYSIKGYNMIRRVS